MAITRIDRVSCSLNLGLIYSVDYNYSPDSGITFTIAFVNQQGVYTHPPKLQQKESIKIGQAQFSVYVVESHISYAQGRRIIEVEFVDELFMLGNYHVVLTGKGCGYRVYELGIPVDNRTVAQKQADSLTPIATQIAAFTQFPDVEYKFNDFLLLLRQQFPVTVLAPFDPTLTNTFTGTFREVLDSWCKLFNLSFFFENGTIKVFDPVNLFLSLPTTPPLDCIEFDDTEDIRDTYSKTVCNWFQQQGGEKALNQTSNNDGKLLTRSQDLFPVGYEFALSQTPMDLNQVVAAQFGDHFWFLYNYYKGTTAEQCGWSRIAPSQIASTNIYTAIQSLLSHNNANLANVALVNSTVYEERFKAYEIYGKSIAGRYYLSEELGPGDLAINQPFQWFNEVTGQIINFTTDEADAKKIAIQFISPPNQLTNALDGTIINQYFPGVNYIGDRMVYVDNRAVDFATVFALSPNMSKLVDSTYQSLFSLKGSDAADFSEVGAGSYVGYLALDIPQDLALLFENLKDYFPYFEPGLGIHNTGKFAPSESSLITALPVKGIARADYASLRSSKTESHTVKIVPGNDGPNVTANTGIIKTEENGAYKIYYNKYADCASANSQGNYFQHRFDPNQISPDIAISFSFSKQANNTYRLNRDFSVLKGLVHNPVLPQLAQPRTFPTRRISFTLNRFYDVPVNFLTNGLVGMHISVGSGGISSSYTFSNEILAVPNPVNRFKQWEQQMRNSATRHYFPKEVIS